MAFLPFYVPGHKRLKIVIAGGGYAGMAALMTLHRYMPEADITLIDPRVDHLKITHLHETFRYPLSDLLVPFSTLAERFGFRHIQSVLRIDDLLLSQWQRDQCLQVDDLFLPFDYLLIASGAQIETSNAADEIFDLSDFMTVAGSELLDKHLAKVAGTSSCISLIGGGATGIQFMFEIADYLQRQRITTHALRLIDGGDRVLRQFPKGFARYVDARMLELDIEFYPQVRFLNQQAGKISLEDKNTGQTFELPSIMTLVFSGKKSNNILATNSFGQVMVDRAPLKNIFAAGDCTLYQSFGSNAMTAQSAVRKGKLAARNILRHASVFKVLEPYLHRDIGYVVSLGPVDAVGWLALENNVVTGLPALVIKEIVEAQYDLLLTGVDTYLI